MRKKQDFPFSVLIEGEWRTFFAPAWVPLVVDRKADTAGWCDNFIDGDICPLAAYCHVFLFQVEPEQGQGYPKYCTRPFVQAGLIPLKAYMQVGGCGAEDSDYNRARKIHKTRTMVRGSLLELS